MGRRVSINALGQNIRGDLGTPHNVELELTIAYKLLQLQAVDFNLPRLGAKASPVGNGLRC